MKRQLLILSTLTGLLVAAPVMSAEAAGRGGHGGGHGRGHGHGHGRGVSHGHTVSNGRSFGVGHNFSGVHGFGGGQGCGIGLGFGFGGYSDICGYAELYREIYKNVPHFALHPPVYYSYPVPRTYGYSPFAYPPYVMTPEIAVEAQPVTIINPHVPKSKKDSAKPKVDRTAAASAPSQPLVIINPFVAQSRTLAQSER